MNKQPEKARITAAQLQAMREVNVRTVDKNTLVDIRTVKINTGLPPKERILDYISQIKNPYCYLVGDTVVKVQYSGNKTLEQVFAHYLQTMDSE